MWTVQLTSWSPEFIEHWKKIPLTKVLSQQTNQTVWVATISNRNKNSMASELNMTHTCQHKKLQYSSRVEIALWKWYPSLSLNIWPNSLGELTSRVGYPSETGASDWASLVNRLGQLDWLLSMMHITLNCCLTSNPHQMQITCTLLRCSVLHPMDPRDGKA